MKAPSDISCKESSYTGFPGEFDTAKGARRVWFMVLQVSAPAITRNNHNLAENCNFANRFPSENTWKIVGFRNQKKSFVYCAFFLSHRPKINFKL